MWRHLRTLFAKGREFFSEVAPEDSGPRGETSLRIRIVALLASDRDCQLLSRMATERGWAVYFAGTCGQAWDLLRQEKASIVLCDRDFPGTEWRDVIQLMSSAPQSVYVVLLSRVADDYLWNEVIRRGGYDLLPTPLREEEVLRAIRLGWSYWNSSMRVPPMLVKHYR
jgi:DNA-binding response OmpR family regulator